MLLSQRMVFRAIVALVVGVSVMVATAGCATRGETAMDNSGNVPSRFVQDRFAIGFWVDPPIDEKADARYQEIADAHFSLVIGGFGANNVERVEQQLALCEKYGLKAVVGCRGVEPELLPDGPACWGYSLRDEPSAKDFPALRAQSDAILAARPGKLAYINLFPDYANAGQLGTPTYAEHVARFCEVLEPDVLSMDHYPKFVPGSDGRDRYCENLAVMRENALANGIPFWNFFNTMPYGPHTDPSESQLRWQVFASIAHGAKGVLYFCYYTPAGGEFPKGGAIISRDDLRTRHWYQARRLNEQLKNLGPTLMQLTSTGVYRVKPDDDPETALAGAPLRAAKAEAHDPALDLLVGAFTHADGRRGVLLMNYRFAYTQWPTIEFDVDAARVVEVDKWSGRERPIIDDSPALDGLQLPSIQGKAGSSYCPASSG